MGRDNKYTKAESFTLSPLFFLLPKRGSLKGLRDLAPSLYAKHEKVQVSMREFEERDGFSLTDQAYTKVMQEELMLKTILDWINETSE